MTMTRILQNHDKVKEAFDKYADNLEKINERRQLWKNEIKQKIIETLTLVKDSFKFDWSIQKIENLENYQTINIHINKQNSGIIETNVDFETGKTTRKALTKYGGYLAFCQSYNGKINVIIGFPYIDECVTQKNAEVIATLEPSQITEETISQQVIKFFQTMSEWEGMDRPPIGFKS